MKRHAWLVVLVLVAAPVSAQTHYPGRVQEILNTFAAMHPSWVANDVGDPSPRFQLNQLLAEQVCFELGASWGMKRAGEGRPVSSDVLARWEQSGALTGWDWEVNHNGSVEQFPPSMDLTGQTFVPVTCQNHFESPAPKPSPTPTPVTELSKVLEKLDQIIEWQQGDSRGDLDDHHALLVELQKHEEASKQDAAAIRADIQSFRERTLDVVKNALEFAAKYLGPPVAAWIAAKKI
jgi:hypothetical protein